MCDCDKSVLQYGCGAMQYGGRRLRHRKAPRSLVRKTRRHTRGKTTHRRVARPVIRRVRRVHHRKVGRRHVRKLCCL